MDQSFEDLCLILERWKNAYHRYAEVATAVQLCFSWRFIFFLELIPGPFLFLHTPLWFVMSFPGFCPPSVPLAAPDISQERSHGCFPSAQVSWQAAGNLSLGSLHRLERYKTYTTESQNYKFILNSYVPFLSLWHTGHFFLLKPIIKWKLWTETWCLCNNVFMWHKWLHSCYLSWDFFFPQISPPPA